ncbi:MAG TPA: hypothetical protein VKI17_02340 [Gemmataceae bacterium]|nr:hypothetical protein [Gemmataceae bacterium]
MTLLEMEQRIARLEKEIERIKARLPDHSELPWWQQTAGMFKGDKAFAEIVRLGREIREADRRKARKANVEKRRRNLAG